MTTRQHHLLTSLVLLMSVMGAEAQTTSDVPRLVVSVVVDQLRTDYLDAFSPLYGEGGFRRLLREGCVYQRAEYPFSQPDRASAVACLMSGATPYENGIVGERWLSRENLQPQYCVGGGTPASLAVSTLTDELKLSTASRGLVYSVAPQSDAAVLAAGHAADGAFWMDDETGQWVTSSYYEYPTWLTAYNRAEHAANMIKKLLWTPINDRVAEFSYFVADETGKPFRHQFRGDRQFREFKASALVNEEVTEFVSHCLQNTTVGDDAFTDYLSVAYYAGNYDHHTVADYPMELQDTYVRLDYQIERLIRMVEEKVGRERVLFVLTSTGYSDAECSDGDMARYRIPTGEFNITRAQGILNMYLSAVYGQAQYIEGTMGNQLYLDQKVIEQRALNLSQVLERCAEFLIRLSGVRDVYTSTRLTLGLGTDHMRALRNAYNPRHSGDILIQVSPGWTLVNEQTGERRQQRDSYMTFPLVFYGGGIEPQVIVDPVSVDRLAPSVARCLRIRAPSASSAAPLTEMK